VSRMRGPGNERDGRPGFYFVGGSQPSGDELDRLAYSTVANVTIPQNCSYLASHDWRAFELKAPPLPRNHALE
jgi:hypothetical protein